ncbi:MAG: NADH-quinone oxidoreductase subunit N [Candidatus Protochlamydia sp.]|nr:NADH-quinone oxidoreductase subunit N [Candidatus Protochlamydia sp.]
MKTVLHLSDLASLAPLLILLFGALVLILLESFFSAFAKKSSYLIALGTIFAALVAFMFAPESENPLLTPWIRSDAISRFFTPLFLMIGLGAALLSVSFFQRFQATHGEYYFLLLSCLFGLILIGSAADFLTLFLGIETLSISLYVLCGYMKKWEHSHESAFKYFIMGSLAAAFLLYGIALIYGAVGTTRLDALLPAFQSLENTSDRMLFYCGIAFVTLGLAFEAALVPFHAWAPDVYDGAPTPVTAFMAVGTKAGAFAAFVRLFFGALPHFDPAWAQVLTVLAYLTLIYGNFVALRQFHLRRFFAYSGISHAGFLLIPVVVGTPEAFSALAFYLIIYTIATLGCFSVIAFLDRHSNGVMLNDLNGLFSRSPWLAGILSLCLLTLAGIPPTAGFLAKFYVFSVAFQAGNYGLVLVGLATTILSAYYYLRIIGFMFSEASEDKENVLISWPAAVVGAISFASILLFSFSPWSLFSMFA